MSEDTLTVLQQHLRFSSGDFEHTDDHLDLSRFFPRLQLLCVKMECPINEYWDSNTGSLHVVPLRVDLYEPIKLEDLRRLCSLRWVGKERRSVAIFGHEVVDVNGIKEDEYSTVNNVVALRNWNEGGIIPQVTNVGCNTDSSSDPLILTRKFSLAVTDVSPSDLAVDTICLILDVAKESWDSDIAEERQEYRDRTADLEVELHPLVLDKFTQEVSLGAKQSQGSHG